jgi:peptidoglycan hydrolase CwlO-like protein
MSTTLSDIFQAVLKEEKHDPLLDEIRKHERLIREVIESKKSTPTKLAKKLKAQIDTMDQEGKAADPAYKPIKASEERIRMEIQRICGLSTNAD